MGQKFVRKPTKKLRTHLGFSRTRLKLCSRHATSRMHVPSLRSPLPAAPHWPRPWRAGMQLTGLETGFQHIWWNGNRPVEDPGQAASKQDPGRTELTHTWHEWGGRKKERKKEEKNLKSKTPSVLPKATSKEAASLTAGRQHNAADTECSIWAGFPRIGALWAKCTNSSLTVQSFSFSSTHANALGRKQTNKHLQTPSSSCTPRSESEDTYFKYSLLG